MVQLSCQIMHRVNRPTRVACASRSVRRAFGLLQMAALMSVMSLLMLITVKLLWRATQVHQKTVAGVVEHQVRQAVADRLRTDLASASGIKQINADYVLISRSQQPSIEYRLTASTRLFRRERSVDEAQKDGQPFDSQQSGSGAVGDQWLLPEPMTLHCQERMPSGNVRTLLVVWLSSVSQQNHWEIVEPAHP